MINPYMSGKLTGYAQTQDLYESLVIENIQISGLDVVYIPRSISSSYDPIFGEDVLSSFNTNIVIEMYMADINSFGGESEIISKFGLEIRDTATFVVSRKRYNDSVVPFILDDRPEPLKWRPNEGDLIYMPISKSLMEIKFVEDEFPGFYQLGKKYVWSLRCELVQLNNETFNTGDEEIDNAFNINADRLNYNLSQEDGFSILTEDGGCLLLDEYVVAESYAEIVSYGDNEKIKKEFMDIMNFNSKNPFNERF